MTLSTPEDDGTRRQDSPLRGRRAWVVAGALVLIAAGIWVSASVNTGPKPTASPASSASTPESTPTTLASPMPEPTHVAAALALPGQVTTDPSLPSADPLPAGIWESTTAGWSLAVVAPHVLGEQPEYQVLYLVDPEGARYQVLELDPRKPVSVQAWSAGTTAVVVAVSTQTWAHVGPFAWDSSTPTHMLDLPTGALTPLDLADVESVRAAPDGTLVWSTFVRTGDEITRSVIVDHRGATTTFDGDSNPLLVAPNGRYFAVLVEPTATLTGGQVILDTQTPGVTPLDRGADYYCGVFVWRDADTFLGSCGADEIGKKDFFEFDMRTGVRTDLDDAAEAALYPLLFATCVTADGEPWGVRITTWGDWYEPLSVKASGKVGSSAEIVVVDGAGMAVSSSRPLGCGPSSLVIAGNDPGSNHAPAVILYWPADGHQAPLVPRPEAVGPEDVFLWSVTVGM